MKLREKRLVYIFFIGFILSIMFCHATTTNAAISDTNSVVAPSSKIKKENCDKKFLKYDKKFKINNF